MKPEDRIHRSPRLSGAPAFSPDRPPMLLAHLGQHARVRLSCSFCGWSRTYGAHALVQRLQAKGAGGPQTAIAHVARHVQWPCPLCHRMGWGTQAEREAAPTLTSPNPAGLAGGGPPAEERVVEGAGHIRGARKRPTRALITKRARELRKAMSEPEVMLWSRLRGRTPERPTFRRQHPIGTIIVDFYCPMAQLAIEVDGRTHWDDEARAQDAARDRWLAGQGIAVVRLPAGEIYRDVDAASDAILRRAAERIGEMRRMRLAPSTARSSASGPPPAISAEMGEVKAGAALGAYANPTSAAAASANALQAASRAQAQRDAEGCAGTAADLRMTGRS